MGHPTLTLCGTYTLEPFSEVVQYWFDYLGIDAGLVLAPYAQPFQQLLDPTSELRRNGSGANAVLLRWTDLLPHMADSATGRRDWSDLAARVSEVAGALQSFDHQVPCLVLVGPADHPDPLLQRATSELQSRLADTANVFVEHGEHAMQRYGVERIHDPASDRFGHVPFTLQAMAALGTAIARWYTALVRSPVKVVAVDADHTLWSGVIGEDGVDGIQIGESHASLQRALVDQNGSGRLLCLLSKNEESDVRQVFERHPQMPLQWSHLVAHRVDWNPKPDNLTAIASALELGLDSVVFLDDNPVECAEMRRRCPAVATVRVPTDPLQLASFADHLWLFDQPKVTAEDRRRAQMYRDTAARAELRQGTDSLQTFLDSLELVVEMESPTPAEAARLAQLTQRTNQFNASMVRCDERDVFDGAGQGSGFHRFVQVRDRFGDYGIVGQIRAHIEGNRLAVDIFLLSCRALGRGIEYRMIAAAGDHAVSLGLEEVAVLFRCGERNAPAKRFLDGVFKAPAHPDDQWFRLPARVAAGVEFDASRTEPPDEASAPSVPVKQPQPLCAGGPDMGGRYEHIAHALTTSAQIQQAIASRIRPRSELSSGYVAPAPGLEREIASLWQDVLRIAQVGSHDRFQDLGGKSVHLVQVHGLLLDRLNLDIDITTLFQHPTVSSLAAHLSVRPDDSLADAAQQRGMKMRDARARAARRSVSVHSGAVP